MCAVVAEWLRRLTRNQIPSGSVGSNPTDCENVFFLFLLALSQDYFLCHTCCDACSHSKQRWFSGRMLACHAGGPGSIPGRCMHTTFSFYPMAQSDFGDLCFVSGEGGREGGGHPFLWQRVGVSMKTKSFLEMRGIDPRTSRMLSERSTI